MAITQNRFGPKNLKQVATEHEKNEELHEDLEQVLFSKVIDAAEIRKRYYNLRRTTSFRRLLSVILVEHVSSFGMPSSAGESHDNCAISESHCDSRRHIPRRNTFNKNNGQETTEKADEKSEKEKSQLREEFTKKIDEETRRLKNEINCAHEERLRVCETYNKMLADLKREHQEEIAELKRYHMEIVKGHYNKLADMHSEMLDIQEQYQKRIDDFIEAYRNGQADRASENLEKFKRIADCVNSLAFRFKSGESQEISKVASCVLHPHDSRRFLSPEDGDLQRRCTTPLGRIGLISKLDLRDEEIERTLAKRDSLDERSANVDDIVITRTFILRSSSMEEDLEPGLTIEEVFDEDSNEFEEGEDN
ncbi:hypothetical protein AAG570_000757 [Ranatra chinensis]|uniref:Uncharacterized protein n=1 Tax=Ranatra chinensis TaxID=642074 RepID=A0ABD0YY19_9HEMI